MFKLGLNTAPGVMTADRRLKRTRLFYDYEVLAVLRFRHVGRHFLKLGGLANITLSGGG
jgi:hypothetical protein